MLGAASSPGALQARMSLFSFPPPHLCSEIALGPDDAGGKPDGPVLALLSYSMAYSDTVPSQCISGDYMHKILKDALGSQSRRTTWLITQKQQ